VLNAEAQIQHDDDTPKRPDPSYDEMWSAQAKRYQRLLLEQKCLKSTKPALN
jgi:hypothetical protein